MWKYLFTALLILASHAATAAPLDFNQAKLEARRYVYFDRNTVGDEYCGCKWEWAGRNGGRFDLDQCGYQVRTQPTRAERVEWEHIVPASELGRQRQCWQQGGRSQCSREDGVFSRMEADLHNLAPVVGEVNGDRGNFQFGMLPNAPARHGACDFRVDFQQRLAQPAASVRGMVARVYFYMADQYGLSLSRNQQQLFMAWDRQYPVDDWERERDRRIAERMGHSNPFVIGSRSWRLGGAVDATPPPAATTAAVDAAPTAVVHGNRQSRIYHLAHCPSYNAMAARNQVTFADAASAEAAGYRRAGNCRP
ncbi:endonuclease [Isoalcanivorax beigongshangi]|uniref:Endonuclease n=1 Tax=Isoalcanivorax beigongshangi TaxID=3238810 RepID=A0ABV4AHI9_9GAMM